MGMFDTVVIEGLKLPSLPKDISAHLKSNNAVLPKDFQTKDLISLLETYFINAKGQIYRHVAKPTGKKIAYKMPFSDWRLKHPFLIRLYWKAIEVKNKTDKTPTYIQQTTRVKEKANLTQSFEIYTYKEIGGRFVDVSFNVTANKGKVTKIKLVKCDLEAEQDAKERHEREAQWQQQHLQKSQARSEFQAQWYYPIIRETYNPLVFFARIVIQKACNAMINFSNRWNGV